MGSKIEWTDRTWNPTLGCSQVSPGCTHCYAIRHAHRGLTPAHRGLTVTSDGGLDWTGQVRLLPGRLSEPLRWPRPRGLDRALRIFVGSMSDMFHTQIPGVFIGSVWDTMARAEHHIFQVLTKRPQRARRVLTSWAEAGWCWRRHDQHWCGPLDGPPPNVWLGTSIETDRYTWRTDHLRETPAAVRFLSLEPLLGPLPSLDLDGIDWVILGGESGPGARPMDPDWAATIIDHCRDRGVPVFVKQLGAALGGRTHHDIDTFPPALQTRQFPHDPAPVAGPELPLRPHTTSNRKDTHPHA